MRNRNADIPMIYRSYSVNYAILQGRELKQTVELPESGVNTILQSELFESITLNAKSKDGRLVAAVAKGRSYTNLKDQVGMTDPARLKAGQIIVVSPSPPEVGSWYTLDEEQFFVVGTGKRQENGFVYLSWEDYQKGDYHSFFLEAFSLQRVEFATQEEYLSKSEEGALLAASFPEIDGITPRIEMPQGWHVDVALEQESHKELYLIYGFSVIAVSVMIGYLVDQTSYDFSVERITGAKRFRIFTLVAAEFLTLSVFPAFVGVLFHAVFQNSIFDRLNIQQFADPAEPFYYRPGILHYEWSDYVRILLLILVLQLAISLLFLARRILVTPTEMKRRAL